MHLHKYVDNDLFKKDRLKNLYEMRYDTLYGYDDDNGDRLSD